jgi:hypothetical protein
MEQKISGLGMKISLRNQACTSAEFDSAQAVDAPFAVIQKPLKRKQSC